MKIDWELTTDGKSDLKYENFLVKYEDNIITFTDKYGKHTLNIDKEVYQKEDDTKMTIDFKNKIFLINVDNKEFSCEIESKIEKSENGYRLKYKLGDETKEIIITRKEEI